LIDLSLSVKLNFYRGKFKSADALYNCTGIYQKDQYAYRFPGPEPLDQAGSKDVTLAMHGEGVIHPDADAIRLDCAIPHKAPDHGNFRSEEILGHRQGDTVDSIIIIEFPAKE
jgi:hypothetical protein